MRSHPTTVTDDTITDEQIHELRLAGQRMLSDAVRDGTDRAEAFDVLLNTANALYQNLDASDGNGTWIKWRARCAEILNERNT